MSNRRATTFLIGTAFLSTMGFGVLGPVLPFIVSPYLSDGRDLAAVVGWLSSVYAICQVLASPGLGALSDRYGRRPLLLVCLLGSAAGYLLFGVGGALWVLFLSRIIDGLTGANFSIVFASLADSSTEEERGRLFGLFGAVAGVGFVLGPALGGLASHFGARTPVFLTAALTLLNLAWGWLVYPETLAPEHRAPRLAPMSLNPLAQFRAVLTARRVRWLLVATFIAWLPFAAMQSTGIVLIKDSLDWNAGRIGLAFAVFGLVTVAVQGVLIPRVLPRFGDRRVALWGLACQGAAYALLATLVSVASPVVLLAAIIVFGLGDGLLDPSLRGIIAAAAGPREQGRVQGSVESVQALAMIAGPLLAGALYTRAGHAVPSWLSVVAVAAAAGAFMVAVPAARVRRAVAEQA
jgi:DHA1 family tetracycline resistance protein-like MFS transporter